jgi:hypothetical protein
MFYLFFLLPPLPLPLLLSLRGPFNLALSPHLYTTGKSTYLNITFITQGFYIK